MVNHWHLQRKKSLLVHPLSYYDQRFCPSHQPKAQEQPK